MMRMLEAPRLRAASTKDISLSDSTTERITRPPNGIRVIAMAMMTVTVPEPSAMAIAMASIRSGKDWRNSMMRWLTMSNRPPRKPQARPQSDPSVVPSSTAAKATMSEVRLPWMTRLSVSRPIWSVPNRCSS